MTQCAWHEKFLRVRISQQTDRTPLRSQHETHFTLSSDCLRKHILRFHFLKLQASNNNYSIMVRHSVTVESFGSKIKIFNPNLHISTFFFKNHEDVTKMEHFLKNYDGSQSDKIFEEICFLPQCAVVWMWSRHFNVKILNKMFQENCVSYRNILAINYPKNEMSF